ncbi:MAG: hypothetical protein H6841_00690 [Planctomycetes bacterium]|nr:hypothetical protein [Planctomycetota bacterium]
MALENYTRGQKIFMVTLVVLLAAMFTVTGAMISIFGQGGKAPPADQGTLDGEAIRLKDFNRKKRALGIIIGLDRASPPSSPDGLEFIYARVPTLSVQEQYGHDWPYNAQRPVDASLLEIWPHYQDQHIWCHLVLAKRAREAGVAERGTAYVGRVVTALMNENRQDIDKFDGKDLTKKFEESYGSDLGELLPTFKEAFMVRDYVESLVADERARLAQVARIAEGNNEEVKAEFARLKIDYFLDQARRDVVRESFAYRSSRVTGGFGVATPAFGYDRSEEAYDKNKTKTLNSEASFSFDIIRAYPQEMVDNGKVEFEKELLELIYRAVREEMFKANEDHKKNIEARLDAEFNRYDLEHSAETKDWDEARIKQFKDEQRGDMLNFLSFYEAEVDLKQALMKKESLQAAQTAISGFQRYVSEQKAKKQREITAEIDVIRRDEAIWEAKRAYTEDLRNRLDSLETQLHSKLRNISNQLEAQATGTDPAANSKALERLVDEFARELQNLDREQIQSLLTVARVSTRSLERELNDKRAEQEEFQLEKEKRTPGGQLMTDLEVQSKLDQFRLEVKAIEVKIRLRDEKSPRVEAFAEDLRSKLAGYELLVRNAREGDLELRRDVLRELLVEMPVEIGAFIRDSRDAVAPEDEVGEYRNQAELIRADYQARQRNQAKDAADTREWDISRTVAGLGLSLVEGGRNQTWEKVVTHEDYGFLEGVDGAKSFLEDPTNAAGSTSKIMAVPGQGYIILRLMDKTPKYTLGRGDAADTVTTLASMRRARELTVEAMKQLRREVLKDGWNAAIERARARYGAHFEVQTTPFINDKMDIPGVYSDSDNDVLKLSSSPSATAPDQPFVSRIKDIDPAEGVSEVISEKHNPDPLRRPEHDQWAYLLARIVERQVVPRRLSVDSLKESQWGSAPAEIWRNRHLATSEVVRKLITPADILAEHKIVQYKPEEPKDNKANDEGEG